MTKILHVNASARGDQSDSLKLAELFLSELRSQQPELEVDRLDLFDGTLPEFGTTAAAAKMAVFAGQTQTPDQVAAWDAARAVFDRLEAADAYVFNIPFWNAGVPYVLKQWVDIVTQPGWSFGFDPATGYSGLLQGKKAFCVYTSGVYAPGLPASFGADFTRTFFQDWLEFVGVKDHQEVHFGPTVVSADVEGNRRAATEKVVAAAATFL
jgi:FMN-dependent NADH-azoreductase